MINYETTYKTFGVILMMVPFYGCIEEFQTEFVEFESALVVDASITNEFEKQTVLLSRTYEFGDEPSEGESNAQVWVTDDSNVRYEFEEVEKGLYKSTTSFAAESSKKYNLSITTDDGRTYSSTEESLEGNQALDSLYAARTVNGFGEPGIGIFVNTLVPNTDNGYYRYEYEETFKVIAPRWNAKELEVIGTMEPYTYFLIPRPIEEQVCYPTNVSNRLILADTEEIEVNQLENFMVKFIPQNDFKTTHRYSILVRQHVLSQRNHQFLETLNDFSSTESLFSETQPGFLEGNVTSTTDKNEKVLGYFDVVFVSERRIFFGYRDFFPTERLPDYIDPCNETAPINGLADLVRWDLIKYIKENEGEFLGGPFITVPQVCGDCTILGDSTVPEFWIE